MKDMQSLRKRLTAGLIHLGISVVIASLAIMTIFWIWYPGVLATAQGVNRIVLILILVDVALGPLLTTIAFDPCKTARHLRIDLSIIGAVQLAALIYGMHAISTGRPAYVVFNIDRFTVVAAGEVDRESLLDPSSQPDMGLSWLGPRTVAARLPDDPKARYEILVAELAHMAGLAQRPKWYLPYQDERDTVLKNMRPIAQLRQSNEMSTERWQEFVNEFGGDAARIGYLPMIAKAREGIVVVDAKTADVLGIRLFRPFWDKTPPPVEGQSGQG